MNKDVQETEIQTRKSERLNPGKLQIPYDVSREVEGTLTAKNTHLISLDKDSGRDG